jgi:hypothetical protein
MVHDRLPNHFFNPAVQLSTSVIGWAALSAAIVFTNNRFPYTLASQRKSAMPA